MRFLFLTLFFYFCCGISQGTLDLSNTSSRSELMLFKMEMWELMRESLHAIEKAYKTDMNVFNHTRTMLLENQLALGDIVDVAYYQLSLKIKKLEDRIAALESK